MSLCARSALWKCRDSRRIKMCFLCVARALLFFSSAATFGNTLYAAMRKKGGMKRALRPFTISNVTNRRRRRLSRNPSTAHVSGRVVDHDMKRAEQLKVGNMSSKEAAAAHYACGGTHCNEVVIQRGALNRRKRVFDAERVPELPLNLVADFRLGAECRASLLRASIVHQVCAVVCQRGQQFVADGRRQR